MQPRRGIAKVKEDPGVREWSCEFTFDFMALFGAQSLEKQGQTQEKPPKNQE